MVRWTITGLQQGVVHAIQGIKLVARNPNIRRHKFLRIILYLSLISFVLLIVSRLVITLPIYLLQLLLSIVRSNDSLATEKFLGQVESKLQDVITALPFLALLFMRYAYPKPLDELFMESLRYIDSLHPDRPPYASALAKRKYREEYWANMKGYFKRMGKNVKLGLAIYLLSLLPIVGPYVFPAAGAYTTFRSLGQTQGAVVGVCFLFMPRWATISLIRALIGMRALMRELLEPYFARMSMSHKEKRRWFSGRKDVLFGFSAIAYILTRIPIFGLVGFGIAQAASAYMLTIVTEPPTPPNESSSPQAITKTPVDIPHHPTHNDSLKSRSRSSLSQ
ncbi:hypothetical protein O0I10_010397 [Lichtheimia ornata]|uniref:Transmembrane protein n=1 Tax=Lichtheimia ornata TaxID=688661 RepID=A0AAD7XV16_9FUNG|nr:uncharacterized protein O0I10_010397 [Lichtheimia ornata]KAJ8653948.1 hypothetical protein O0I10_010397 [Lichtheimia ornata]